VAGGVHEIPMISLFIASGLGLGLFTVATSLEGRPLRLGVGTVLPFVLFLIPLVQSLPLPFALRGVLDPNGNALLRESEFVSSGFWPLSLDPSVTRAYVGKGAAALAIYLVAFHLASGKRLKYFFPILVAAAGLAAVAIGLGHKILSVPAVYGLFKTNGRSLLTGPFVNANHTAELLELATFVCLACSFRRNNALNRIGWLTGALLCGAGTILTLSRGSVIGLVAGTVAFVVLYFLSKESGPGSSRRATWAWGVLGGLVLVGTGAVLGAGAMIDRFRATPLSQDLRFQLWRDTLRVLASHPAGIGRGAFEHVYPVYKTPSGSLPFTFVFVENQPLQYLVDSGWLFFAVLGASVALLVRQVVREGRRDKVEAALLAGLIAVAAHNTIDFGLEMLGVMLPFMAILGTVMGRSRNPEATTGRWTSRALAAATCAGLAFGVLAVGHASADDFDQLVQRARTGEERRALLRRAQATHPTDYFYALSYARTEPLRQPDGTKSPRLHALNRALQLCPNCNIVHEEVARSLWQLGSHGQALSEWRTAIKLWPQRFHEIVRELYRMGATPRELAAVAAADAAQMVEVAGFLAGTSGVKEAMEVLEQAEAMGAPRVEALLTRARLQLQAHQISDAQGTLAQVHAEGVRDARVTLLDARVIELTKGAEGADEILAILDLAAARDPLDLEVQRLRIDIVSRYHKWKAADRAIDGLKLALYHAVGSAVEANLAAARIRGQLSQWTAAFSEYRVVLGQRPNDVALWLEFGQVAEKAGRDVTAREAYTQAARLVPSSPNVLDALKRLDARRDELRASALRRSALGQ
jgi:tetratricopeptide (TPR) repeat protein